MQFEWILRHQPRSSSELKKSVFLKVDHGSNGRALLLRALVTKASSTGESRDPP
jgi:hypothetical protein